MSYTSPVRYVQVSSRKSARPSAQPEILQTSLAFKEDLLGHTTARKGMGEKKLGTPNYSILTRETMPQSRTEGVVVSTYNPQKTQSGRDAYTSKELKEWADYFSQKYNFTPPISDKLHIMHKWFSDLNVHFLKNFGSDWLDNVRNSDPLP